MAVRPRGGRARSARRLGQHSLRSQQLAARLVGEAGISSSDLIIEIGAGNGILTRELADRARQVIAVDLDVSLAVNLITNFSHRKNVLIVAGDFFCLPLPAEPFRVFGNIPFGCTTQLLRHLLDPTWTAMARADLIVERGAALKRARSRRGNVLNLGWAPWWTFTMGTEIPARLFVPRPSVDAAMLSIAKRREPLLPVQERTRYIELVRSCMGATEIDRAIRPFLSRRRFKLLAGNLGIAPGSPPTELGVHQWIGLYYGIRGVPNPLPREASHAR